MEVTEEGYFCRVCQGGTSVRGGIWSSKPCQNKDVSRAVEYHVTRLTHTTNVAVALAEEQAVSMGFPQAIEGSHIGRPI